jgi:uncharacterized protein (TIGR03067 family)
MTYRLVAAVLFIVVIQACGPSGEAPQSDLDKVQGTWTVAAGEENGKAIPKEIAETRTFTFTGDKAVVGISAGPANAQPPIKPTLPEFTFKLDPTKKPKTIDVTFLNGEEKGRTRLGIYQLEGDELKVCMPTEERTDRPSDFKAPKGSDLNVVTLKRSKK